MVAKPDIIQTVPNIKQGTILFKEGTPQLSVTSTGKHNDTTKWVAVVVIPTYWQVAAMLAHTKLIKTVQIANCCAQTHIATYV